MVTQMTAGGETGNKTLNVNELHEMALIKQTGNIAFEVSEAPQ